MHRRSSAYLIAAVSVFENGCTSREFKLVDSPDNQDRSGEETDKYFLSIEEDYYLSGFFLSTLDESERFKVELGVVDTSKFTAVEGVEGVFEYKKTVPTTVGDVNIELVVDRTTNKISIKIVGFGSLDELREEGREPTGKDWFVDCVVVDALLKDLDPQVLEDLSKIIIPAEGQEGIEPPPGLTTPA